jgi:hypothetical protein
LYSSVLFHEGIENAAFGRTMLDPTTAGKECIAALPSSSNYTVPSNGLTEGSNGKTKQDRQR